MGTVKASRFDGERSATRKGLRPLPVLDVCGSKDGVPDDYHDKVSMLAPAKALAIAAYGESVAAYRYRTLSDKAPTTTYRDAFIEMATEEQGHHADVQSLLDRTFPNSDFVLSADDKSLIIVGPRLIEVTDRASFDRALVLIYESELLTGRFYRALHGVTPRDELKPLLKEMGDECFDHADRLKSLSAGA